MSIKRSLTLLLALILCLTLVSCGTGSEDEPEATEAPASYTVVKNIRYWPEDADYETCDYALIVDTPKFAGTDTSGYSMNLAVGEYLNGLAERVEKEYMPASVAQPPYTEVSCEVDTVDGITNVVFTESHCYEAQPYTETYVLMLNERGEQVNLRDVLLSYHAEDLVASALEKKIAGDGRYYEADAAKILTFLDLVHGARTLDGGFRVYIPEGRLASLDEGELAFDLTFAEAAPDFVGEGRALSWEEYRGITELLGYVSNGCVVRGDEIADGAVTAYAATSFMGELAQGLGYAPEAGRISVPADEFEKLFRACFGTDFPGIDTDAHDIRLEDGSYSVRFRRKEYRYNVDMLSVTREGGTVSITGDLMFGDFGYAFTDYICHVSVTLHENSASPFGFTLDEFLLRG